MSDEEEEENDEWREEGEWGDGSGGGEEVLQTILGESSSFADEDPSGFAGSLVGNILGSDLERNKYAGGLVDEIVPLPISREEAAEGLCKLGKTADGLHHAYLMIKLINKRVNDISVIMSFKHVMYVDVSDNLLTERSLGVLKEMEFLLMLRADNNRVKSCRLPEFPYLQFLALNNNNITSTDGITQPFLEVLELNENQIKRVTNLNPDELEHLKHIELRGNALETTDGLMLPTLERLYLAENLIERIENLDSLCNLQVLHLRENPLNTLDGFSPALESLIYLNLRECNIESLFELRKLVGLPKLDTLIVWDNPFVKRLGISYRIKILTILPKLSRIDKSPVQEEELVHVDEEMEEENEEEESSSEATDY